LTARRSPNKNSTVFVGELMRTGLAITLFMLSGTAHAAPHDFVVQLARVGGDTQTAQPQIDALMRYLEQQLKWPPNSAHGLFVIKQSEAEQYIEQQKPGYGIFDPEIFFALRKKHSLEPLAAVKIATQPSGKLHVVVNDPKLKTLADLKGKKGLSDWFKNPAYLSRVAFKGFDFEKDATLETTSSPLKGIKAVVAGTADFTVVDDSVLPKLKDFGPGLHSIADSGPMPPTMVVAFGKQPDAAALTKTLLGLCSANAELCKNLTIEKFMPLDKAAYEEAVRKYEK
jgi:ABC-type phosphate/phosphonate transport system substrate-binding protein